MSPLHTRSILFLLALAASANGQQSPAKVPAPLPAQLDLKAPIVALPATETSPRELSSARPEHKPIKVGDAHESTRAPAIDFSRVFVDEAGDGTTWVRGRTYKASFGSDGATYIPFLGSQAPRNFPVRVELATATLGGEAQVVSPRGVTHDGTTITIARGALREVWHMGLDAAEQTFEIDSRPASGPIELQLAFVTELVVRVDGEGLALEGSSGGVRIGRATAVDADGRRLDLATQFEAGVWTLAVPAEFARTARYPLVVDPIYSTNASESFSNECGLPDVSNAGISGDFATVFDFAYSATDSDIYTVDSYYGFPVAGTGTWVDATAASWSSPRIAHNALANTFLTVAQVRAAPGALSEIWCRARTARTTNQYAQRLVQSNILGSCFYADVGGDPALAGPTYFLAAWTRNASSTDWDIHARLINYDGTVVGSTIFLENSLAFDWRPSVSKTNGRAPYATQNWNIVWMRNTTSSNVDILGAQVRWDGVLTTPAFAIDSSTWNDTYPSASSPLDGAVGQRPWMCAFARNFGDTDIHLRVLSGGTVLATANLSALEGVAQLENQIQPDVDSNGQRFVVAYSESYQGSTTDRDAYVATVAYADGAVRLDEGHVNFDYSTRDTTSVQICGNVNSGNYGIGYYGLAWQRFGSGPGDTFTGAYYEPASFETFCFGDGSGPACPCGNVGAVGRGCPNSVTTGAGLAPSGTNFLAADTFELLAYNMPNTTAALFFQGTGSATGTPFGDGLRCVSGPTVRIGTKSTMTGYVRYPEAGDLPISVKGLVPTDGSLRTYQVWYRNAANFCTAATFNVSSAVRVRWLR